MDDFLAQMKNEAATPLASLSSRWTALPQTLQTIVRRRRRPLRPRAW
ncbi:MAG: hypothetical protein QM795_00950 [Pseudoxanthomonas sp.]